MSIVEKILVGVTSVWTIICFILRLFWEPQTQCHKVKYLSNYSLIQVCGFRECELTGVAYIYHGLFKALVKHAAVYIVTVTIFPSRPVSISHHVNYKYIYYQTECSYCICDIVIL